MSDSLLVNTQLPSRAISRVTARTIGFRNELDEALLLAICVEVSDLRARDQERAASQLRFLSDRSGPKM